MNRINRVGRQTLAAMALLCVAALILSLAGCQTAEECLAADDRQCQSYGVQPGSAGYVQCRMNLDTNRANVRAAERFGNSAGLVGTIERWSDR